MALTVLVTGGTGQVGRHVVAGLLEAGASVRALARTPGSAGLPDGVEVVGGDVTDAAAVERAAAGADAAFLLWPGFDPSRAGDVVAGLGRQVRRVVYLSAGSETGGTPGVWADLEAMVRRSAAEWVFLRPGGFARNTLGWADRIRAGERRVPVPYVRAARALIHEQDIAEAAVRGLLGAEHGVVWPLSGAAVLTQGEQVALIGAAIGVELVAVEQPLDEARAELVAAGFDAASADS